MTKLRPNILIHLAVSIILSNLTLSHESSASGVCSRSPGVQLALVSLIHKTCEQITANDLLQVTSLSLSHKGLKDLQALDFHGLSYLRELFLDNNKLTFLPWDLFKELYSLETLHLNHNQLTMISHVSFHDLYSLKKLRLDHNQIAHISSLPGLKLTSVQVLNFSNNKISQLPENIFENLSSLLWLNLSHNSISSLPDKIFHDLTQLRRVSLSHNAIVDLSEPVFSSDNFSTSARVDLRHNQLSNNALVLLLLLLGDRAELF